MLDYAIFVQARLGSTRFPQKVLAKLGDKRVLDHVLDSCAEVEDIPVFLLTPESDVDHFSKAFSASIEGGSSADVLDRFHACAKKHDVKNVIRVTSDCPVITAAVIRSVVKEHQEHPTCFVSNVEYDPESYSSKTWTPDGFDVEVFSADMLELAHRRATTASDREHVTSWMRRNCPVKFLTDHALALRGKFSIDSPEDLLRIEGALWALKTAIPLKVAR